MFLYIHNTVIKNVLFFETNYNFQIQPSTSDVSSQSHSSIQHAHPLKMPLAETNHQTQFDHPLRTPLAEANHQTQLGHPLRMLLAEANHQFNPAIHVGCHLPKLIIKHNLVIHLRRR